MRRNILTQMNEAIEKNKKNSSTVEYNSEENEKGTISRSSSSASTSSTQMEKENKSRPGRRPKRASSQNVDYNLKKRRIIPSDNKYLKTHSHSKSDHSGNDLDDQDEFDETSFELASTAQITEKDSKGKIIHINDGPIVIDTMNGATGLPLSQLPPEKVKKESLWNVKKISVPEDIEHFDVDDNVYKTNLLTKLSIDITQSSDIREIPRAVDICAKDRKNSHYKYPSNGRKGPGRPRKKKRGDDAYHPHPHVMTKIKAASVKESKSKLFGQNTLSSVEENSENDKESAGSNLEIENDDFCSTCSQSGSFLCCDTCPRSFHFLCLNPPLDPDHLPEGDWSCPNCVFKLRFSTNTMIKKAEKDYVQSLNPNLKLFGKLLFQLESANTTQFKLPSFVRNAFANVNTGSRNEYTDERAKEDLSEKQIFHSPYGQSVSKLDTYNPDTHIDPITGEFLLCYKCGTSKMGTWENYMINSKLIMKCDYCNTPWHLDCIPDIPRASMKNLGSKWRCPLHAVSDDKKLHVKYRRLAKHQKKIAPLQLSGYKNNGDIEVALDEVVAISSKPTVEAAKNPGNLPPIPLLSEFSIKMDFMDKIYKAKKVQRANNILYQEHLINKLVNASSMANGPVKLEGATATSAKNLADLLYFKLSGNKHLKKLWDFKELCLAAETEASISNISNEELRQLALLKKLLESKPKEEIIKFLNQES